MSLRWEEIASHMPRSSTDLAVRKSAPGQEIRAKSGYAPASISSMTRAPWATGARLSRQGILLDSASGRRTLFSWTSVSQSGPAAFIRRSWWGSDFEAGSHIFVVVPRSAELHDGGPIPDGAHRSRSVADLRA